MRVKTIELRIAAIERKLTGPSDLAVESFSSRLRRLRNEQGWTQVEMAKKTGISLRFIGHLENGKRTPGAQILYLLARELGVSMDFLWTGN